MKIAHWTWKNGSGMHRVVDSMVAAECAMGLDSVAVASNISKEWEVGVDADIHIINAHLPIKKKKGSKLVWVGHGTPEHCFSTAVKEGKYNTYGQASDTLMLVQHWLQVADALVTFWPRHQRIYQSLVDKNTIVDCIPMGIDKSFWKPGKSRGKYRGNPSILTAENCHEIKWPLDLFLMWPWVSEDFLDAVLHALYIPLDQHRWWFPLINRNGASYRSIITNGAMSHDDLVNAFRSIDYYIGLVRYGDFNRICLEAKATGCKVISYAGNPYADYWLTEGDQGIMAEQFIKIIKGETIPRKTSEVVDIKETAKCMMQIYERICNVSAPIKDTSRKTEDNGGVQPTLETAAVNSGEVVK